jgi:hypothetical protein
MAKGSYQASKTHCKNGHEFNLVNTGFYSNRGGRSCRICCRETAARWRANHPDTNTHRSLMRKYGITIDDYRAILQGQSGCCAICGTDDPGTNRTRLGVDHCHATKKVRGLLCDSCNVGIGKFRDDPARLRAAADYLELFK